MKEIRPKARSKVTITIEADSAERATQLAKAVRAVAETALGAIAFIAGEEWDIEEDWDDQ